LRSIGRNGYSDDVKFVGALTLFGMLAANAHPAAVPATSETPEEDHDFLSVTDGPCIPKIGVGIEQQYKTECQRMTGPRRYRGRWFVAFETSFFTPVGQESCIKTKGQTNCAELIGKALPWPGRWDCAREFEVEFVGRRNVLPGFYESAPYKIVVDRLISAKRLPDPYDENCDSNLHPELKTTE